MYTNKAHLIAMNAQLTEQLAMVRVAGHLSKSTEVMTIVNDLVKVRNIRKSAQLHNTLQSPVLHLLLLVSNRLADKLLTCMVQTNLHQAP